jgi:hypothetical protein
LILDVITEQMASNNLSVTPTTVDVSSSSTTATATSMSHPSGDDERRKSNIATEPLPPLYSIHKGIVQKIAPFGCFVAIDGSACLFVHNDRAHTCC